MDEVTMTVGQLHSGAAANVIPEKAWMEGTLRTFNKDTAEYLIRRITEMAEKTAEAYRAQAAVTSLYNVPMVNNDPKLNLEFADSIRELDDSLVTEKALHVMGSEDFTLRRRYRQFIWPSAQVFPIRPCGEHSIIRRLSSTRRFFRQAQRPTRRLPWIIWPDNAENEYMGDIGRLSFKGQPFFFVSAAQYIDTFVIKR